MDLPPGFHSEQKNGKVCRLKKSSYGLKQSPRAWFDRFARPIQQQGYKQSQTDHTVPQNCWKEDYYSNSICGQHNCYWE